MFVGAIPGIVVAFVLALINLARRASSPAIDVLEADGEPGSSLLDSAPQGSPTAPGVLVIRMAAPLFFANGTVFTDAVTTALGATPGIEHVVIDLEAVTDIDVTAAEAFEALKGTLAERSVTLAFSRPRRQIVDRMRVLGLLGNETVYPTNRAAIAALTPTGKE
nr:sodium-independent anion transporter [Herbiconiux sp. VKM Ac-2851]